MSGRFRDWRSRIAAKKIKPGDGRTLKRFRWWQSFSRSLFFLTLTNGGDKTVYAIDVRHAGNASTGEVEAHLYFNGSHSARSTTPAAFAIEGGLLEVATSAFGLRRCHYVPADGAERQLAPDSRSPEGRRADFEQTHPGLSRFTGWVSLVVAIVGLAILIPQIVASLSQIPAVAEIFGSVIPPIELPVWGNIVVTLVTGAASTERALRLRYNVFLDGGSG